MTHFRPVVEVTNKNQWLRIRVGQVVVHADYKGETWEIRIGRPGGRLRTVDTVAGDRVVAAVGEHLARMLLAVIR